MLLNAVMALALKNGRNRESVARSMKVMEHEWVVDICMSEAFAEEGRRGMALSVVEPVAYSIDDGPELYSSTCTTWSARLLDGRWTYLEAERAGELRTIMFCEKLRRYIPIARELEA